VVELALRQRFERPHDTPAAIWRAVLDRRIESVVCPHHLAELGGVLERPTFRRYVTVDEAQTFVAEVARFAPRLGVGAGQDVFPFR
jgi:predicted nucleic acid-binding protein